MDILNQESDDITLNQFLNIYILPEIEQRKKNGIIIDDFQLTRFQILFHVNKTKPEIRLNEECRIVVNVKLKDKVKTNKGDEILWENIESISGIELDETDDANCGHITYLFLGDRLMHSFDFRYNKKVIAERIKIAKQFLDTSRYALEKEFYGVYIDNIFSATEIAAQACLLVLPDKDFLVKTNHKGIKNRLNQWGNLGNIDPKFTDVLNKLTLLRKNERYFDRETESVMKMESVSYHNVVEELIEHVKNNIKS